MKRKEKSLKKESKPLIESVRKLSDVVLDCRPFHCVAGRKEFNKELQSKMITREKMDI
jgi:hypothetical protein